VFFYVQNNWTGGWCPLKFGLTLGIFISPTSSKRKKSAPNPLPGQNGLHGALDRFQVTRLQLTPWFAKGEPSKVMAIGLMWNSPNAINHPQVITIGW
jgi:hypothetical protein